MHRNFTLTVFSSTPVAYDLGRNRLQPMPEVSGKTYCLQLDNVKKDALHMLECLHSDFYWSYDSSGWWNGHAKKGKASLITPNILALLAVSIVDGPEF